MAYHDNGNRGSFKLEIDLSGLLVLLSVIFSWFITCGVFAIICWVLTMFDITSILGWTVQFSWKAATAFWLILTLVRSLL